MATAAGTGDGTKSVLTKAKFAPILYWWYQKTGEPSLMMSVRRILQAEGMNPDDISRFVGEFRDRILLGQEGRLKPIANIKGPLDGTTNLALYEIRWKFSWGHDSVLRVRAYHAEPKHLYSPAGTRAVVGLHVHKKVTERGVNVRELQDTEIKKSAERYFEGKGTKWGLQ